MITCGLDIGAGETKGALVADGRRVLAVAARPTFGDLTAAGNGVLGDLLEEADLDRSDISYVCTTGFGRYAFAERDIQVSDITSSAHGAVFLHPATRTVLDIGNQSTRAIRVAENGRVLKFRMNQKCAAGAGRFVERCCKYLQVPVDRMDVVTHSSKGPRDISSVCAVLAETEIINYVTEEVPVEDILMGVLLSLAQKAHSLMKTVSTEPDISLVGGLSRSDAMRRAFEKVCGSKIHIDPLAPYTAAIGGARLGHVRKTRLKEVTA